MANYDNHKKIQQLDGGQVTDNSEFIFTNGDKALKAKRSDLGLQKTLILDLAIGAYMVE